MERSSSIINMILPFTLVYPAIFSQISFYTPEEFSCFDIAYKSNPSILSQTNYI